MAVETFYHWDSFLWDFGFSTLFLHPAASKNSEMDSAVIFCTFIDIVTETAIVSFRALPVGLTWPTISKNSLSTLSCPLILHHCISFIISVCGPKVPVS